jgi:translation initiation factor 3 subunit B
MSSHEEMDLNLSVAAQLFPEMPLGFPYVDFEVEELILPDGDNMGIGSDDDDVKEEDLSTNTGFGSCVGEH